MRAVITVVGKDTVGILAKVSSVCADHQINVIEVTQSILQDMFCMIMMTDLSKCDTSISELSAEFEELGKKDALSIHVMHEDIFNSMHKI